MRRSLPLYALLAAAFGAAAYAMMTEEPLVIRHGNTEHRYHIEVAATPEAQEKGLMYRKSLPADHGMLFVLGEEKPIDMWMKNTYIPLDMLFFNRAGTIVHIVTDTTPLSEDLIPSVEPTYAVLELPAGTVKSTGIAVGDHAEYHSFTP